MIGGSGAALQISVGERASNMHHNCACYQCQLQGLIRLTIAKQNGVGEWIVLQIAMPCLTRSFMTAITCKMSMLSDRLFTGTEDAVYQRSGKLFQANFLICALLGNNEYKASMDALSCGDAKQIVNANQETGFRSCVLRACFNLSCRLNATLQTAAHAPLPSDLARRSYNQQFAMIK